MGPLLIALLGVMLLPLFIATWRTSLLGLSLQGLLMGWLVLQRGAPHDVEGVLTLVDLVGVRGLLAPLLLYRLLSAQNLPRRNDVIPPNMLSWTVAVVLVILAFRVAGTLTPAEPALEPQVAVSAAGLLLGFFVLATREGPVSQVVGALRIENAIALFELAAAGGAHGTPLPLRVGQLAVFVVTVFAFVTYVRLLSPGAPSTPLVERPPL